MGTGERLHLWLLFLTSVPCHSMLDSGHRAGYDGAKMRKGSKAHIAVDISGHLPSVFRTGAGTRRRNVATGAKVTGLIIEANFSSKGSNGQKTACEAAVHAIGLQVIVMFEGQTSFVLSRRRSIVECSSAWCN